MKGKPEVRIDWSEAPEGATHFQPENNTYFAAWFKQVDQTWYYIPLTGTRKTTNWTPFGRLTSGVGELIARPVDTRNGEGLPPVGTVCEWLNQGSDRWLTVEVVFLSSWVIVVRDSNPHPDGSVDLAFDLINQQPSFRAIRTVEQIAAEERRKAINEITDILVQHFVVHAECPAAATSLYDAGYRKTEGGAQ